MSPKAVKRVRIFIDGASRGNPGPASVGVVVRGAEDETVLRTVSKRIGVSTNNIAEYCALVIGLQEALALRAADVEVFTDSELVARQYSGEYKIKDAALQQYFVIVSHLKTAFKSLRVTHVPRELNKDADREANKALDEQPTFF
ncbi:MAG: Bifunctional protein [Candidatus Omnitrophica bacterium]|nr:Bifunctional protein [Candidatus Omnitrophota bacterium]